MAIQIRRGNIQDFDSSKLLPGEWAVSLDNKKVFIAFAPGDTKQMATYEDMITDIQDATQEIIDNLTAGVDEAINNTNVAIETINQTNSDIQAAEEVREQQEQERQTNTETAIQNTNEATDRAISAAEAAEGIVAGTGMVLKTDVGIPGGVAAFDDVYSKEETDIKFSDVGQEIDNIEQQMSVSEVTLAQDYKSIFNSGTGKDSTGAEQDFSGIVEGQSNVKLEGLTANNLVKNGDFSNGATYWAAGGCTISVSNGTLKSAGKGEISYPYFIQAAPSGVVGHKYYLRYSVRVTNVDCKALSYRIPGTATSTTIVSNPNQNQWYTISTIKEAADTSSTVAIYHNYESATIAKDKVMEVKEVMCIDITSLGLESLTKEQCNFMFDHYIDGIQGVGSGKLVSVGKNLFDKSKAVFNKSLLWAGDGLIDDSKSMVSDFIPIKNNVNYVTNYMAQVLLYDANKSFIRVFNGTNVEVFSFIATNPHEKYVRLGFRSHVHNYIDMTALDDIQVEEGLETTSYKPCTSSELITTLPAGMQLHRLPNGIADTIEEVNGTRCLIKRVRGTIYNGSESGWVFGGINGAFCTFNKTFVEKDGVCFSNTLPYHETAGDWERIVILNNVMYIKILNSRLNTQDLNGFKAWLQANPTTVIYESKTPTIQKSGEGGFSQVGNLEVYPNGTIYQEHIKPKESTNAKTYINYNLSTKAVIMSNSTEITGLAKNAIDKSMIVQNALSTNPDTVASGPALKSVQEQVNVINNNLGFKKIETAGSGAVPVTTITFQKAIVDRTYLLVIKPSQSANSTGGISHLAVVTKQGTGTDIANITTNPVISGITVINGIITITLTAQRYAIAVLYQID